MTSAVIEHLDAFLKKRDWTTTRLAETTIRTSFKAPRGQMFPLIATHDGDWVKLAVVPLGRLPPDLAKAETLYAQLLRWNGELMFARFSLDEDGDVILSVEFPVQELDDSEIADALDVLTYYANKYGAEIRSIIA
ncbi:MAG: YbjN domain-containing protein [Myxococcales bacterium]|nr:YbjN domain-containing protein [Myxococcales bacterium]